MDARFSALRVLQKVCLGHSLPNALAAIPVDTQDEALRKALCYGVCRWHYPLREAMHAFLKKPLKRKDQDLELLLLLGIYQLHWMDIPDYAAVHATTALVHRLKKTWAKSLINAVLRQAQSQDIRQTLSTSVFPDWLEQSLSDAWPSNIDHIQQAHLSPAPMTLRVNTTQCTPADYHSQLTQHGIACQLGQYSQQAIVLETPVDVTTLPGFASGACSVQDESAQLAATLLDLAAGQRVLDACAAPGGKSTHILELCPDLKHLTLLEKEADRATKITENIQRLQLHDRSYELIIADANDTQGPWTQHTYDRILLDAPCSATGITRRHPDIPLVRKAPDLISLAAQQHTLLNTLWPLLSPNGLFLYATCSIMPCENQQQIALFLEQHPDATQIALPDIASHLPIQDATDPFGLQLLPNTNGPDGFYYALLRKNPKTSI